MKKLNNMIESGFDNIKSAFVCFAIIGYILLVILAYPLYKKDLHEICNSIRSEIQNRNR